MPRDRISSGESSTLCSGLIEGVRSGLLSGISLKSRAGLNDGVRGRCGNNNLFIASSSVLRFGSARNRRFDFDFFLLNNNAFCYIYYNRLVFI